MHGDFLKIFFDTDFYLCLSELAGNNNHFCLRELHNLEKSVVATTDTTD